MPELSVSRKTISKLLSEMQNRKFIIPDFQRPYKWDMEKCETLWNDIRDFHESMPVGAKSDEYFLGTIVSCKNESNEDNIEIIDGQQRITSFFLILRAFYKKLENMPEDLNVIGLKNQLAPCIWDVDSISQQVADRKKLHVESLVATDDDKAAFHDILETGFADSSAKDLYSINFNFFKDKCEQYAKDAPMQWQPLCVTILHKCIILPIECNNSDTALTIFSTLNDRGLPLSDSDIFKAQIYKSKPDSSAKETFTNAWKELTSICKSAGINLDEIFRYYTHIVRAKNNDKSKETGLRKFYAQNNYEKLKSTTIINDLTDLANFWLYINTSKEPEDVCYKISLEARKFLHCLDCYPNDFWKYITSVFFHCNKDKPSFEADFAAFLKKLTAFLFVKFIHRPTVNAIKDDIYSRCVAVFNGNEPDFKAELKKEDLPGMLDEAANSRLARALILLHAYLNAGQRCLISKNFEIEHIFPYKWQTANYNGWSEADARVFLEKLGNKVAFEKRLNIQAGNNYFGNKKKKYSESKIQDAINLSHYKADDWAKNDIVARNTAFAERLSNFFSSCLG